MNQDQVKGKWHQLKGEIKTKWAKMADNQPAAGRRRHGQARRENPGTHW